MCLPVLTRVRRVRRVRQRLRNQLARLATVRVSNSQANLLITQIGEDESRDRKNY
jgi:histidinol-phosphate/aromatic aminotransferase/cobyric acid decarboxylase-like protein